MTLQNQKIRKRIFQLLAVALGAWTLMLFSVPLLGPIWHFLHGDSVDYEGWQLPVPKGFYARTLPGGPTMWKPTLGVPFFSAPYGHISVFHVPSDRQPFVYARDFQSFSDAISDDARRSGYQFNSNRVVNIGKTAAYCVEFSRSIERPRFLVRCRVENAPIAPFYEGDERYLPDFFSMLEGISPKV
jgi:hypothetical protein